MDATQKDVQEMPDLPQEEMPFGDEGLDLPSAIGEEINPLLMSDNLQGVWKDAVPLKGFYVPEGTYTAKIDSILVDKAKTTKAPMIVVYYKILGGANDNCKLRQSFMLNNVVGVGILKSLLETIGIRVPDKVYMLENVCKERLNQDKGIFVELKVSYPDNSQYATILVIKVL